MSQTVLGWQVAELASSGASDDDLAAALVQVVVTRFLQADEIPRNVTLSARDTLNGLLDALKPGQYGKGRRRCLSYSMMAVAPNDKLHAPKDIVMPGTARESTGPSYLPSSAA